MQTYISRSEAETETIGEKFAQGLESSDELFDIGWEDYLGRGAVCAVEWSEKVEDAFYGDETIVRIEKLGDTERRITIEGGRD